MEIQATQKEGGVNIHQAFMELLQWDWDGMLQRGDLPVDKIEAIGVALKTCERVEDLRAKYIDETKVSGQGTALWNSRAVLEFLDTGEEWE